MSIWVEIETCQGRRRTDGNIPGRRRRWVVAGAAGEIGADLVILIAGDTLYFILPYSVPSLSYRIKYSIMIYMHKVIICVI